mgnify:CR=1 FL=1
MEGKFKIEGNTVKLYLGGSVKQIKVEGTLKFPWVDGKGKEHHLTEYQKYIAEYEFPKDKDTFICVGIGMGTTYALKLNESLKDKTKCYYGHTRLNYGFKHLFNDPCDYMLFDGGITADDYKEVKDNGHNVVSAMLPQHFKSIAGSLRGDYNLITWEHSYNPHIEDNYKEIVNSLTESNKRSLLGGWE